MAPPKLPPNWFSVNGGRRRAVERRAGIQIVVAEHVKRAAVVIVGAALGNHADLRAAGRAGFGGVDCGADAELGDGVEGDVQPRIGLLGLLLDAAGVDAVEDEVAVIERMAVELDGALPAVAVVDGARRQQHEAGPVPPVDRNLFDLLGFHQAADFGARSG